MSIFSKFDYNKNEKKLIMDAWILINAKTIIVLPEIV